VSICQYVYLVMRSSSSSLCVDYLVNLLHVFDANPLVMSPGTHIRTQKITQVMSSPAADVADTHRYIPMQIQMRTCR